MLAEIGRYNRIPDPIQRFALTKSLDAGFYLLFFVTRIALTYALTDLSASTDTMPNR